jgi:chromosome partitioning protein
VRKVDPPVLPESNDWRTAMANVISMVSSKGGTGKTTVALNLAVALAEKGDSTLLMDIDPLGAIGLSLARNDTEWSGLAEYIIGKLPIEDAIIQTRLPQLAILPRGRLDPLDVAKYESVLHSTQTIKEIVNTLGERYKFIIIDAPSGLGMITVSALMASNFVLLPLQAEALSLRSIQQSLRVISHVKENGNPELQLLGILATMVQLHQDSSFNILRTVWSNLSGVLETYVPRADVFALASDKGLPVAFLGGKYPPEALRFELLATEIKKIIQDLGGITGESDERSERALL